MAKNENVTDLICREFRMKPELVGWKPDTDAMDNPNYFKEDQPPVPTVICDTNLTLPDISEIDPAYIEAIERTYSDPNYDIRYDASMPSMSIF